MARRTVDKVIGANLEGRIPSVVESLYFLQNHGAEECDAAAQLDRKGPGIMEGCHRVEDLSEELHLLEEVVNG
jgi:hypothetical protein